MVFSKGDMLTCMHSRHNMPRWSGGILDRGASGHGSYALGA